MMTKTISPVRRLLIGAMALATASVSVPLAAAAPPATAPEPQLMFVQLSHAMTSDPATKTLRLVDVNPQSLYFADRPVRLAGHLKMDEYLAKWTKQAGKDNFGDDPPNATISVYEKGKADSTLAVIEILNPRLQGKDLVYNYKVIEGKMPKAGGETSLFIDTIGLGGGVGPGFHGVGVGRRGPGIR